MCLIFYSPRFSKYCRLHRVIVCYFDLVATGWMRDNDDDEDDDDDDDDDYCYYYYYYYFYR